MVCDDWQTIRLGDVCLVNPEKRGPSWAHKVMEYIDISAVGMGILNQEPTILTIQDAPSRAQRLVRNGDVIVSTVRPNHRSFLFLKAPKPNTVVSTGFAVFRATEGIDPRFLYYVVSTQGFTDYLEAHTEGSAYPAVNPEVFEMVRINLPPLSEQRATAHILGTLDHKIELNRRINETLEAIARAIFKSWFVDFDPVIDNALKAGKPIPGDLQERATRRCEVLARARAEGSSAGLPDHLARLFPDEFGGSELGWIPKEWAVVLVGEALKVVGGSTPSTKEAEYWDGGKYHWATPKDLSGLSASILLDTEREITAAGLTQISSGLLPSGTVLISSRAPVGYLALSAIPLAVNKGLIAMICDGPVSNYYALNWCYWNMDEIKQRASGTTFAEIGKATFRLIPMIVPDLTVMHRYTDIVRPFYHSIRQNLEHSRTLAAIPDVLLPKLISGEIRVREAEKLVERAMN